MLITDVPSGKGLQALLLRNPRLLAMARPPNPAPPLTPFSLSEAQRSGGTCLAADTKYPLRLPSATHPAAQKEVPVYSGEKRGIEAAVAEAARAEEGKAESVKANTLLDALKHSAAARLQAAAEKERKEGGGEKRKGSRDWGWSLFAGKAAPWDGRAETSLRRRVRGPRADVLSPGPRTPPGHAKKRLLTRVQRTHLTGGEGGGRGAGRARPAPAAVRPNSPKLRRPPGARPARSFLRTEGV